MGKSELASFGQPEPPPTPPSPDPNSEPIPITPTFDMEHAAFSASFFDRYGGALERHSIEPLPESLTDQVWALAGSRTKSDHRLLQDRQLMALRSLAGISSLTEAGYEAWIKNQPQAVRRVATFGRRLHEEIIVTEEGEQTNLLDQMIKLAENKLENTRRLVASTRR